MIIRIMHIGKARINGRSWPLADQQMMADIVPPKVITTRPVRSRAPRLAKRWQSHASTASRTLPPMWITVDRVGASVTRVDPSHNTAIDTAALIIAHGRIGATTCFMWKSS
jgi:hypothetical protein